MIKKDRITHRKWLIYALKQAFSVPAAILAMSTIGFGGFAKEMGFSWLETIFIIPVVWALPSQVTFMTGYMQELSLISIFITVSFTAMRLFPMAASFLPLMRSEKTSSFHLILFSHLVVITTWVEGQRMFHDVEREHRSFVMTIYGVALVIESISMATLGYVLASSLPTFIVASLVYTIPLYFCLSLLYSAQKNHEYMAFIIGLFSLPFTHALSPDFDLIMSGILGGTICFLFDRKTQKKIKE